MKVSVKVCDILSENSEALLMTIDGTIVEPGGSSAWGNVGQATRKKWTEFWLEIESRLDLPIELGDARIVDMSDNVFEDAPPWKFFVALSGLDHSGTSEHFEEHLHGAVMRGLNDLAFYRPRSIISTLPSGFWRVKPEMALNFVESARRRFIKWDTTWIVYERNNDNFEELIPLAKRFGWSVQDTSK